MKRRGPWNERETLYHRGRGVTWNGYTEYSTVECQFLEPEREREIGSRSRRQNKVTVKCRGIVLAGAVSFKCVFLVSS